MATIFLLIAAGCFGLLVLMVLSAANTPTGPMGLAGPAVLLFGGTILSLLLAGGFWIFGG